MPAAVSSLQVPLRDRLRTLDFMVWLGVLFGIAMPLASALIYPTYVHQMRWPWAEWTRLMEMPFVAAELGVIAIALRRGMKDRAFWDSLPRDLKVAAVLLLVGLTVSSLFVSRNVPASAAYSLFTLIHIRFAFAVYYLARAEGVRGLDRVMQLLCWGVLMLAAYTAVKFAFPPPEASVFGGKIEWGSALPGFINVRHFGSWTGAIAAGLMVALLYPGKARPAPWVHGAFLLATTLTAWSGTRAAVLAMAVVAVIFLASQRRLPRLPAIGLVAALGALALAVSLALPQPSWEFSLFAREWGSADGVSSGRLTIWLAAIEAWLRAPVFGLGSASMFWEVKVLDWSHTQPHNVVIQYLLNWGIVGAAGGLWILGRTIAAVHPHASGEAALRPLSGVLYSLLFMSLLEGMLHYPRFIIAIAAGFAIVLAHKHSALDKPAA